jgi:hypothetical protein
LNWNIINNGLSEEVFTLLLHKDAIELTEYHHKRRFFSILLIFSKAHQLVDPADDIDLRV